MDFDIMMIVGTSDNNMKKASKQSTITPIAAKKSKAESSEEKLRRAQRGLEVAKSEAQRILSPILQRMERSRKIKTADNTLKTLSVALEHPHKMRTSMDRGNLEEAVAAYRKGSTLSPITYGAKVVQLVKGMVDAIAEELKKLCNTTLTSPDSAAADAKLLLRSAAVILELDGDASYREALKASFSTHLVHFGDVLKAIGRQLAEETSQAIIHGQELQLSQSSGRNTMNNATTLQFIDDWLPIGTHLRTSRAQQESIGRGTSTVSRGSDGGNGNSVSSSSRGSGGSGSEVEISLKEFEIEVDENSDEADWISLLDRAGNKIINTSSSSGRSGSGGGGGGSLSSSSRDAGDDGSASASALAVQSRREHEICEGLCGRVRMLCVQRMIEAINKWFPCLYRLVVAITSPSSSSVAAFVLRGESGQFSKELGAALALCCAVIRDLSMGSARGSVGLQILEATSSSASDALRDFASFAQEFAIAKNDTTSSRHDSWLAPPQHGSSEHAAGASMQAIALPYFMGPLKAASWSTTMFEISGLFEDTQKLIQQVPELTHYSEHGAHVGDNPFHDALTILRDLSREGEVGAASRMMGKISAIALPLLGEGGNSNDAGERKNGRNISSSSPMFRSRSQSENDGGMGGGLMNRGHNNNSTSNNNRDHGGFGGSMFLFDEGSSLESRVMQIESLVLWGLFLLRRDAHRPEWLAQKVVEGLLDLLSKISRLLRLRAVSIAENCKGQVGFEAASSVLPEGSFSMDNPHGFVRAGDIDLAAFEDSLRRKSSSGGGGSDKNKTNRFSSYPTRSSRSEQMRDRNNMGATNDSNNNGASSSSSSSSSSAKNSILLDILRASVCLRTRIIPKVWRVALRHYPTPPNIINTALQRICFGPKRANGIKQVQSIPGAETLLERLYTAIETSTTTTTTTSATTGIGIHINDNSHHGGEVKDAMSTAAVAIECSKEAAEAEAAAAAAFLQQRLDSLRGSIFAGYRVLAKREISGDWVHALYERHQRFLAQQGDLNNNRSNPPYNSNSSSGRGATAAANGVHSKQSQNLNNIDDESSRLQLQLQLHGFPIHLSNVLANIGTEKRVLAQSLRHVTVERGIVIRSSAQQQTKAVTVTGGSAVVAGGLSGKLTGVDTENDSDSDVDSEEGVASPVQSGGRDEIYQIFLFKELCLGLLDIYFELIYKIKSNNFLDCGIVSATSGRGTGAACQLPLTVAQALEELEFLKLVMKPVLPAYVASTLQPDSSQDTLRFHAIAEQVAHNALNSAGVQVPLPPLEAAIVTCSHLMHEDFRILYSSVQG